MELEHRRYFRYQIILDAVLICRDGKLIPAQILNVSEGGLALRLLDQGDIQDATIVRFTIPGLESITITATCVGATDRYSVCSSSTWITQAGRHTRVGSVRWTLYDPPCHSAVICQRLISTGPKRSTSLWMPGGVAPSRPRLVVR